MAYHLQLSLHIPGNALILPALPSRRNFSDPPDRALVGRLRDIARSLEVVDSSAADAHASLLNKEFLRTEMNKMRSASRSITHILMADMRSRMQAKGQAGMYKEEEFKASVEQLLGIIDRDAHRSRPAWSPKERRILRTSIKGPFEKVLRTKKFLKRSLRGFVAVSLLAATAFWTFGRETNRAPAEREISVE